MCFWQNVMNTSVRDLFSFFIILFFNVRLLLSSCLDFVRCRVIQVVDFACASGRARPVGSCDRTTAGFRRFASRNIFWMSLGEQSFFACHSTRRAYCCFFHMPPPHVVRRRRRPSGAFLLMSFLWWVFIRETSVFLVVACGVWDRYACCFLDRSRNDFVWNKNE